MQRAYLPVMLIAIILTAACKNTPVANNCNNSRQSIVPLKLATGDTINLALDSLLVLGKHTPVDYNEKDNQLLVFDSYNKRLLQYHLSPARPLLQPAGARPAQVKQQMDYFRYLGPDSIMLYSYGALTLFFYSLDRDTVYRELPVRHKLRTTFAFNPAAPVASPATPVIVRNNLVIGAGYLVGEHDEERPQGRTIYTAINGGNGFISYKIPYPKIYWEHNWGGSEMRIPYAAYNEHNGALLLSLPADHNIQLIDSAWNVKDVYAGTRENICITSLPVEKSSKQTYDADHLQAYFNSTPSYRNIIFDKYRQRYYRILQLPSARAGAQKEARIIALDKDLRYIGEAPLPAGLGLDNFFVTANGLYFFNANNKNENIGQYIQIRVDL